MSVLDWTLRDTEFAVVDVETTGLNPGYDRVVEIAVVGAGGGRQPKILFESLVDPGRDVTEAGTHGITALDLDGAPRFETIAQNVARALVGKVVAAHNAYFDLRFIRFEMEQVGVELEVPFLCTMELRPMLGIGERCSLLDACRDVGLRIAQAHKAADDALATARLLSYYLGLFDERGIRAFRELPAGERKFRESWKLPPLPEEIASCIGSPKVRSAQSHHQPHHGPHVACLYPDYSFALVDALSDFILTDQEMERLAALQASIPPEAVRAVHSSVYTWVISSYATDGWVDEQERANLRTLHQCLQRLGWAPGD